LEIPETELQFLNRYGVHSSHAQGKFQPLPRVPSARRRGRVHAAARPPVSPEPADDLGTFLARELHDGVAQTLATMLLQLESLRRDQYGREGALAQIDELEHSTRSALADLRALLVELRGHQRQDQDLVLLLRRGMLERQQRKREIAFHLQVAPEWPGQIDAGVATHLHRIACESLDNAIRHGAPTKIEVTLAIDQDRAVMTICDDGTGIKGRSDPTGRPGFGLVGMRERAEILGGSVSVLPGNQDCGTLVQVIVPIERLRTVLNG
jgi:signal transduction histidine kinase